MTESTASISFSRSRLFARGFCLLFLALNFPAVAIAQQPLTEDAVTVPVSPLERALAPEAYILGAGDRVQVDVFRIPDYSGEYEVLVSGTLNLPMIGQVAVAGLTLAQAEAALSQAYAQRLRRPIVNIFLIEPRPLRIGISGEVSHPGAYTLERDGTQFPTLVSALEAAGGVTQAADLRQIVIQRAAGNGPQQTLVADLWQFLETGDLRYNIPLRDGDTVLIPTRDSFDSAESLQLTAASFAADESRPLNIAVVGEVFRPGPYTVTGTARTGEAGVPGGTGNDSIPPTVTRAIQVAGGIKPEANIREVKVYRRTRNGQEQTIDVNLWQLLTDGDITEDIVLQEGDTVFIPQAEDLLPGEVTEIAAASFSPDTIRVNVVGEVDDPGVVEVPPNTPLSQGVLAAGGFNNRARRGVVELVRLNPDGTATQTSIPIDFSEGIDEDMNPLLRNNDIIIVKRSASASLADTLDTIVVPLGRALSIFTIPTTILNLFD
ncbi:SLBB domain-containing protein [Romeria aff. gracilis LEGE 07310]|uniref:SLBB domain-containing protein n=1 Tax=Vasconcelosia minhoensis LEGE 07310 TaxID=915328 RepID=A0A8J7AVT6_9CYAN|nr:SLBB domain-containing protein [Romeria gracilis]MBE9080049.1 SLBB domain-containing protein [Romeria aff. gracilis LEGE 07310]